MHIIRRTGGLPTVHLFLGHPWFVKDPNRGIAWGVLPTPSIRDLLRVVRAHAVEEGIGCPRYLIGATGEGAAMLCQKADDPLPPRQLIFLNRNDDIPAWFVVNKGNDPHDLMVLESRPKDGVDLDETPKPPNGRYPFLDREVWHESAGGEDSVREMRDEESVDDEEWLEAESEGETRVPHGAGVIYVDDGDVSI